MPIKVYFNSKNKFKNWTRLMVYSLKVLAQRYEGSKTHSLKKNTKAQRKMNGSLGKERGTEPLASLNAKKLIAK
jgi:hypothetical protein